MPTLTPEVVASRMAGYLALRAPEVQLKPARLDSLATAALAAHNTGDSVARGLSLLLPIGALGGQVIDMIIRAALAAVDPGVVIETDRIEWRDARDVRSEF